MESVMAQSYGKLKREKNPSPSSYGFHSKEVIENIWVTWIRRTTVSKIAGISCITRIPNVSGAPPHSNYHALPFNRKDG